MAWARLFEANEPKFTARVRSYCQRRSSSLPEGVSRGEVTHSQNAQKEFQKDNANEINKLNYFVKFGRNVSILLGLGSFLILYISSGYLISTFQPTQNIQLLSSDYLVFRCIGLPFYLVNMHSTAVLRGLKYAKITFYSALIVSISNIFFSLFFGLFLGFGAGGIGFASSLAFFCASIYSTFILKKQLSDIPCFFL